MDLKTVRVQIPDGANIILGQTHFIKTAEDLYEILVASSPQIKFGVAFTEASGPCLIRFEGNDSELTQAATATVQEIGAGHVFAIFIREAFRSMSLIPLKCARKFAGSTAPRQTRSKSSLPRLRRAAALWA
jgi:adenosine/AMP kinase